VAGLGDIYAVSKIERGQQLIKEFNIDKSNALIIGDTIHDFEVSQKLGVKCILVADGHQSVERLNSTKAVVVPSLDKLINQPLFL